MQGGFWETVQNHWLGHTTSACAWTQRHTRHVCAHWGFCPDVHSNSFWREYLAYVEEAGPRTWKEQGHSSLLQKQWHIFSHTSHLDICITFLNCFQFSSVAQSCPTLCNPMNCSTPGLPVHHWRPEFTQTHVHWVSDGIQPSHLLSFPSPPALNLSQHWGLFKWVSSAHQVAKVLEFQLQHRSFQWTPRTDLL